MLASRLKFQTIVVNRARGRSVRHSQEAEGDGGWRSALLIFYLVTESSRAPLHGAVSPAFRRLLSSLVRAFVSFFPPCKHLQTHPEVWFPW